MAAGKEVLVIVSPIVASAAVLMEAATQPTSPETRESF